MSTIEDMLASSVTAAIRAHSHSCFSCGGRGRVNDYDAGAPVRVMLEDGREAVVFGKKPCDSCDARGVIVAEPTSIAVTGTVMASVVSAIFRLREDENYDGMNRAIDWGVQFQLRNLEALGLSIEEAMAIAAEAIVRSPIDDALPVVKVASQSALSPQELSELGLDDDGGS